MSTTHHTILSGAVFCNSASRDESGKVNCSGVFTSFLAWAYPTSLRSWYAILTLHNLPEGSTSVTAAISFGRGKSTSLASVNIDKGREDLGSVICLPLRYKFDREGLYTVHFNILGTAIALEVPLKVATQTWPRLTNRQLEFLKKNPVIPHSIRMNVLCSKCSRPYVFEESVLPEESFAGGVLPFPESGVFECESCNHKLGMKDIQGQMRSSIKMAVLGAMKGRK